MEQIKTCSKCNVEQPVESFVKFTNVCKKCRKIHMQKYYQKKKKHIKSHQLDYYNANKDKQKRHYRENKETILNKNKKYYETNKGKINKQKRKYEKNKLATDNLYKLSYSIRRNINISFRSNGHNKKTKTTEILGCSFSEFKTYIENKFEPWMVWKNKGKYNGQVNFGWDLDHIIPLSTAKTEEEIIKLNHYTNFQPLCSKFNRDIKRGRL